MCLNTLIVLNSPHSMKPSLLYAVSSFRFLDLKSAQTMVSFVLDFVLIGHKRGWVVRRISCTHTYIVYVIYRYLNYISPSWIPKVHVASSYFTGMAQVEVAADLR